MISSLDRCGVAYEMSALLDDFHLISGKHKMHVTEREREREEGNRGFINISRRVFISLNAFQIRHRIQNKNLFIIFTCHVFIRYEF